MLRANMELADRMDESAEDMTAAETAPRPTNETKSGHRNCRHIGRIRFKRLDGIGMGPSYVVWFQSGNEIL